MVSTELYPSWDTTISRQVHFIILDSKFPYSKPKFRLYFKSASGYVIRHRRVINQEENYRLDNFFLRQFLCPYHRGVISSRNPTSRSCKIWNSKSSHAPSPRRSLLLLRASFGQKGLTILLQIYISWNNNQKTCSAIAESR